MPECRYRKGDRVRFRFGLRYVYGIIREDRGPIGIKGRRIYNIDFAPENPIPPFTEIELSADDFELAEPATAAK